MPAPPTPTPTPTPTAPADAAVLLSERDDRGVLRLTLNRPEAFNALSDAVLDALWAALQRAGTDETLRAVVIAGAGRAFCAGHDLKEMRAQPTEAAQRRLFERCSRLMLAIQALPVPVLARVHGIATAAGCQLVAMCDLAVAASDARFAVSGINLGLFCSTPAVALSRNLPRKQAFEMLVTGAFIGADEALARGLVNRVAAPEALDAELDALLDTLVAKPRSALALGKALFYRQLEQPIAAAYDDAGQTMACNFVHPDAQEGVDAFMARRRPAWAPAR